MRNYLVALRIREEIGDTTGITSTCLNIGTAHDALGDPAEGKKWFTKSLLLAERTRNKDMIRDSYDGLSESAALSGDFESAFMNYRLSIAYRDSLYNEENTKQLVQAQMRYEFDKKEAATKAEQEKKDALAAETIRRRELQRNASIGGGLLLALCGFVAYRLDRKRRKERFEKDAALLETKALRAQMNPHFIFNAMQAVNTYLGERNTEQARTLVSRFGKVMRVVLENSTHHAVPLAKDLEALRGYMDVERLRTHGKFDFVLEVAPDVNVDEVRVPPLVVQPFLENAIWHGIMTKEGHGRIVLRADQRGGALIFTVEDDGVGRGASAGKTPPEHTSHGTAITRSRLALLSRETKRPAHFTYTDLQPGTRVVITVPLPLAA